MTLIFPLLRSAMVLAIPGLNEEFIYEWRIPAVASLVKPTRAFSQSVHLTFIVGLSDQHSFVER